MYKRQVAKLGESGEGYRGNCYNEGKEERRPSQCVRFPLVISIDHRASGITSVLSERRTQFADQKTERCKVLNPEYNICRDQPIAGVSPLRINTLLCGAVRANALLKAIRASRSSNRSRLYHSRRHVEGTCNCRGRSLALIANRGSRPQTTDPTV